jgi:hypothetical protein
MKLAAILFIAVTVLAGPALADKLDQDAIVCGHSEADLTIANGGIPYDGDSAFVAKTFRMRATIDGYIHEDEIARYVKAAYAEMNRVLKEAGKPEIPQ